MANYSTLKSAIQAVIKQNGNNEITGNLLQQSLLSMINSLGAGFQFMGVATPSTNPGTPDQNVFYIAATVGIYPNFSGVVLANGEFAILKGSGSSWTKETADIATTSALGQLEQEIGYRKLTFNQGSHVIPFHLEYGKSYVFILKSGTGVVTTIKSVATNSYSGETIDTFNTAIVNPGSAVQMVPTANAEYLAFYNSNTVEICVAYSDNLQTQINNTNNRIDGIHPLKYNYVHFGGSVVPTFTITGAGASTTLKVKMPNATMYLCADSYESFNIVCSGEEYNLTSSKKLVLNTSNNTFSVVNNISNNANYVLMVGLSNKAVEGLLAPFYLASINDSQDNRILNAESYFPPVSTMGAATPASGERNYISHIRLVAGHRYRFEVSAAGTVAGTQVSLKLKNSDGTTYNSFTSNLLSNGTWNGAKKTFYYEATEDKYELIIGSYCSAISTANLITCTLTDMSVVDIQANIDKLSRQIQLTGSYKFTSANNVYGIDGIRLIKGHRYRIDMTADGTITGTQVSLKFAKADGSTLVQLIPNALTNGAWDGTKKSAEYYAEEDWFGIKVGSYFSTITASHTITVVVTDISLDSIPITDSTDIAKYYRQKEKEIRNVEYDSAFNFIFFSDIHGDTNSKKNTQRIVDFANSLSSISAVINGGDTIKNQIVPQSSAGANFLHDLDWYNEIIANCDADVLTCVGNHDAWMGPFQPNVYTWATPQEVYQLVTKEVVTSGAHNGSPIIQPANAEQNGYCYYYKDYGTIRVIVLNAFESTNYPASFWDATQQAWFEGVLADARTLSKQVICIMHCPSNLTTATRLDSKWTSVRNYTWGYDSLYTPSSAFAAVDAFIQNGGKFICWLNGHTHYDQLLMPENYSNQLQINITSARFDYKGDGYKLSNVNDVSNPIYDCFNYIGIDATHMLIKVFRIGWNMDCSMKIRNVLCYNYATNQIVSE